MFSESIQDGGKQICSKSRLAETGVDRKEFREVFKAFPFTVTIEFYRESGVLDRDKTFSPRYSRFRIFIDTLKIIVYFLRYLNVFIYARYKRCHEIIQITWRRKIN